MALKSYPKRVCPKCGSTDLARYIFGLPIPGEFEKHKDDPKVIFGGCIVYGDEPAYRCNECETQLNRDMTVWSAIDIMPNREDICLHVPHSGTVVPRIMKDAFVVGGKRMRRELLRMTDWYTDELFSSSLYPSAVFNFSRLVCDVERFLDPAEEVNTAIGMGMYYTHGHDRSRIKKTPFADDKGLSLYYYCLNLYDRHHKALRKTVDEILCHFDSMVLVDCHSFPSVALPYEGEGAKNIPRPDICIGADAVFTPDWLVKLAKDHFVKAGLTVALNTPFSGCLVPQPYYADKDKRVQAIMIEVNRKLYMDEETGEKNEGFYGLQDTIEGFYNALPKKEVVG